MLIWKDVSGNSIVKKISPVFKKSQTLTQYISGTSSGICMTEGRALGEGCFYYEMHKTGGSTQNNRTGLVNSNTTSFNYDSDIYFTKNLTSIPNGTIIGILLNLKDINNGYAKITRDGIAWTDWFSITGNSGTVLKGTLYIAINNSSSSTNATYKANLGGEDFTYTIPIEFYEELGMIYSFDGEKEYGFNNKTLILHENEYKKWVCNTEKIILHETNMTANNAPTPFVASASNVYSDSFPVWKAFDGNNIVTSSSNDFWSNTDNSFPCYIGIDFGSVKKASFVHIYHVSDGSPSARIKNFVIQGSNDNLKWDDIKEYQNETWTDIYEKIFTFDESNYRMYRLYIKSNNGHIRTTIAQIVFGYDNSENLFVGWKDVSSTLPTKDQFLSEGMDSLSPLLDRKVETLEPLKMFSKSEILSEDETGKVFSKTIDLKKLVDIRSIEVEGHR